MIRRLRVRHRFTFGVLAVALPVGFVAAIAARPEFPASETAPSRLVEPNGGEGFVVPGFEVTAPDVLVYLVPGAYSGSSIPENAVLLGSLVGIESRFRVPDDLREGEHTLVYYSLGHGRVVLTAEL